MLADEMARATDVWTDALNDFYVAVMKESAQEPYESDESELAELLSLSNAGGL